jgi:hypothetical protein
VSTRSSAPFPAGQQAQLDRRLNSPANVQQIGAEGETPCCCPSAVISLHLEGVAAHWAVIAMSTAKSTSASVVSTLIPARLERLPWGRFHVLVIAALGITWILDGLEVTLAGSVAAALKESPALRFSDHASAHAPAQRAGAQRLRAFA